MNLFHMKGAWGGFSAEAYHQVVVPALITLYEENMDKHLPRGALRPGMKVLDLGCGPGHFTRALAERYGEIIFVGMDLSERMLTLARKSCGGLPNLSFTRGDALDLPLEDGSFDSVLSMASIKHWPDQARGLREIRRILKPGGMVFILEAHQGCSRKAAHNFVRRWRFTPWPITFPLAEYFRCFIAGQGLTEEALRRLCLEAGLESVSVTAEAGLPAVIARGVKPAGG